MIGFQPICELMSSCSFVSSSPRLLPACRRRAKLQSIIIGGEGAPSPSYFNEKRLSSSGEKPLDCWDTRTRTKNDRTRICSVTITPYPNQMKIKLFSWDTRTRTKNDRTRICSVTITPYPNLFIRTLQLVFLLRVQSYEYFFIRKTFCLKIFFLFYFFCSEALINP